MKRRSWKRRVLTVLIAFAMVLTSVDMSVFVTRAATNDYEATSGTMGADYADGHVTFWIKDTDPYYAGTTSMWYKEYATYEEAAAAHISNGGNFIVDVGATNLTANAEGTEMSATVDVKEGTGAILYYINAAGGGHPRPDYEHIIVIENSTVSGDDAANSRDVENGDNAGNVNNGLEASADGINLETATTELYAGTDWAGAVATYTETGTLVQIDTTNYGWNGEWGLQYMVKDLDAKDNTAYNLEFTALSSIDKKIMVKLDDSGLLVETIELKAGVPYTFSKDIAGGTFTNKILYFAIGQMAGEEANLAGTLDITGVKLTEKAIVALDGIDLEASTTELYAGTDWAGAAATYTEDGTLVHIDATNYGWNGEWGLQYMVKDLEVEDNTAYTLEFTALSSVDKKIMVKLDDSGLLVETIELKAGELYEFSKEVAGGTFTNKILYFAIGQMSGEDANLAGTLDITGVKLTKIVEITGDGINLEEATTELYAGTDWAGAVATYTENATAVHLDVTNYGWNGEWGLQYMVKDLDVKDNTPYTVEFTAVSSIDKNILVKLDDNGLLVETVELKAGVPYTFSKDVEGGPIANKTLYFAIGQMAGEEANLAGTLDISGVKIIEKVAEVYAGINLEEATTELYVGTDWAGVTATYTEDKTAAHFDVTNYGWNGEWGLQYMVKELNVKDNTTYRLEFTATSSIDKKVLVKLDDSGFVVDTIELKEGEEYTYSKLVECGTFVNKILYFALGQMSGEDVNLAGTMDISGVKLSEIGTPVEIAVNRDGNQITFQQGADDALQAATVYYQVFNSETEANGAGINLSENIAMSKLDNELWEAVVSKTLEEGQVIRYYFQNTYADSTSNTDAKNYVYEAFVAEDYNVDTLDRTSEGYDLVWNDEFNGTGLDMTKWAFQIGTQDANGGPANWGNNELEYYTDSNHTVADGKLTITAKQESVGGMDYTSTRIRTVTDDGEALFATTYGRIEARMKLPAEEGLWPAFWMLPEDTSIYGTWAASGELDIMEARGRIPGEVGGTIHYGSAWPNNVNNGKTYRFDTDVTDISGWHLYSVEWEPGKITWLVDDVPYGTITSWSAMGENKADNYTFPAPYDVPFYIVLNLAVGGSYDSSADVRNAEFPATMEVDYVRVYQKSDGYDEENIEVSDSDMDTDSFNSVAFQPTGTDGDYIADTAFDTLKQVSEVVPTDTDWQFFVGDFGGAATMTEEVIDGINYAKIDVTAGGNQNYAVQLIKHIPLAAGYTYEITFDAMASVDRSMVIHPAGDADNSWAGYGTAYTANLSTEMRSYTHVITMDKDSDATARLEFNMGSGVGTIWIGNVTVKQIEADEATDTTDIAKSPLGDGNQIYNGTFDQGTDRLGFWHVKNAEAKVPSVVGEDDYSRKAIITATADGAKLYQNGIQLLQSDQYEVKMGLAVNADTTVTMQFTNKDGSTVYMEETFDCKAADGFKTYEAVFAMPNGVTDKEGVFVLNFENGSVVTGDNISMVRTTKNNVTVDYSDVDLEPVPTDSDAWSGTDIYGGDCGFTNNNGEVSIIAVNNSSLNYQRMLLHEVNLKNGIQYKLTFQAKSDNAETYGFSIQEDNSWALTLGEEKIVTTTEWQTYEYMFTSSLTNGGNPIYLKYLLSGPDVTEGKFYLKDVSLVAVVENSGCKEVPEGAVTGAAVLEQGKDYQIQMSGEWKDAFVAAIEDNAAVVMINETSLGNHVDLSALLNAAKDTLTISAAYMTAGDCKIELAMPGYYNAVIKLTVEEEEPDVPNVPETPDVPNVPETPDVPNVPETPDVPNVPETPDVPGETPVAPKEPEFNLGNVEEKENVPAMSVKLPEDVKDVKEILRKEDIAHIDKDTIVKLQIDIATLSTDAQKLVNEALQNFGIKNPKNAGCFDIDMWLITGDVRQQITDLDKKISITLNIPTAYVNAPAGYTRAFWLVNLHDNDKPIVLKDMDSNPETITIETDGFSTFALVYEDTKEGTKQVSPTPEPTEIAPVASPKTGDYNAVMWAIMVMAVGFVLYASARKYQLRKEDEME